MDARELAELVRLRDLFGYGTVRTALAVQVVGHMVMVLIMTMTPLYLKLSGHGLGAIGIVMSSHIVGMFALSPLTGRLVDRWSRMPVSLVGQATPLAPAADVGLVAAALFLLGLGWNLGFASGSALLSSGVPLKQRARLQGVTDSLVWGSSALSSGASGLILAARGYDALCSIGTLLVMIPAAVMLRYRRVLVSASPKTPGKP